MQISNCCFRVIIVNRPGNGCETVGNIRVVYIEGFKQLYAAN